MIGVSSLLRKRSPHKSSARLIDAFLPAATLATTKQAVTRAIGSRVSPSKIAEAMSVKNGCNN
jgi:hypothetical protein